VLNPSDKSLIQSCLHGDRQAWDRLILRYERLIYNIPLRAGLSMEDAADIFQDVCLLLMNNLEKLTGDYNVAGWLTTTTRWECLRVFA
jgi:RNA polymerase sigma factor (sigma-70 family)